MAYLPLFSDKYPVKDNPRYARLTPYWWQLDNINTREYRGPHSGSLTEMLLDFGTPPSARDQIGFEEEEAM